MRTVFLVEGTSEQRFLSLWCERAGIGPVSVAPHQGKGSLPSDLRRRPDSRNRTLLHQLPAKLRGYAEGSPPYPRVVVLVDCDDDDPDALRTSIQQAAAQVAPSLDVRICVAVEEIEAFYLGDLRAILLAYPGADMPMARSYEPDSIIGTWEFFGKVIGDESGDKVEWARRMGPLLTCNAHESRSPSFRAFLGALTEAPHVTSSEKKKSYRHAARPKSADGRR